LHVFHRKTVCWKPLQDVLDYCEAFNSFTGFEEWRDQFILRSHTLTLNDMIAIEAAGDSFANALKEVEANAIIKLRNVALTTINYIKSFIPVISLVIIFLILLLLVGILSILNRMLDDLGASATVRRRILLAFIVKYRHCLIETSVYLKIKNISTTNKWIFNKIYLSLNRINFLFILLE